MGRPPPPSRAERAPGDGGPRVDRSPTPEDEGPPSRGGRPGLPAECLLALAAIAAATLACWWGRALLGQADQALLLVLAVVLVSLRVSRLPALLGALAGVTSFDYFFVEPVFGFHPTNPRYYVTLVVMLLVGAIVSGLTVRIREQGDLARRRERTAASLYALTRDLLGEVDTDPIAETLGTHVRRLLGAETLVLLGPPSAWPSGEGDGRLPPWWGPGEERLAWRAVEERSPAGAGTAVSPEAGALVIPLVGARGLLGAMAVRVDGALSRAPPPRLLEYMASQVALAIERVQLLRQSEAARLAVETERTRTSLLRSVSHDLRTPLASIAGAAEVLLESGGRMDGERSRSLAAAIQAEADRLTRLVNDLLQLTRLDAGAIPLRKEWCPLEEIVGSALGRMDEALRGREVRVTLPEPLLLVPVDAVLFEGALVNVLENAARYSPPGSPVEVSAATGEEGVVVEVADRGPGIPAGLERRVFEPFFRVPGGPAAQGTGLGLAVVQAVLRSHGGTVEARGRDGGGTVLRFVLPTAGAPPLPRELVEP